MESDISSIVSAQTAFRSSFNNYEFHVATPRIINQQAYNPRNHRIEDASRYFYFVQRLPRGCLEQFGLLTFSPPCVAFAIRRWFNAGKNTSAEKKQPFTSRFIVKAFTSILRHRTLQSPLISEIPETRRSYLWTAPKRNVARLRDCKMHQFMTFRICISRNIRSLQIWIFIFHLSILKIQIFDE